MTDEEATLVVTAGTAMYGLTELGGLVAGESVVVTGPGPIGLLGVAVAKALGAQPVILTGTRDNRLADRQGARRGPRHQRPQGERRRGRASSSTAARASTTWSNARRRRSAVNEAIQMVNRGGKVCLAAFPHEQVPVDIAHIVRNNIYVYGIRGEGKSATHRAEAFMAAEAVRRDEDPHPYVRAGGSADRDPLRQGSGRGRHQGGGHRAPGWQCLRRGGGVEMIPSLAERDELLKGSLAPCSRTTWTRCTGSSRPTFSGASMTVSPQPRPLTGPAAIRRASGRAEGTVLSATFSRGGLSSCRRGDLHDVPRQRNRKSQRRTA